MVHLHTQSCYTLLQSPFRIEQIAKAARENGFSHAALTDKKTMLAVPMFLEACKKEGVKPIIGLSVPVNIQSSFQDILLLAKDNEGLRSLYALSTRLSTSDFNPVLASLKEYTKGVIAITQSLDEWLGFQLQKGHEEAILEMLNECENLFESFYVGISCNDSAHHNNLNQILERLAFSLSIETVALSIVLYQKPEDEQTTLLLEAIRQQKPLSSLPIPAVKGRYFRSQQEMETLYTPEQLENAQKVADSIHYQPELLKNHLPDFHTEKISDSSAFLKSLSITGLKKRMGLQHKDSLENVPAEYKQRLEMELDVIVSMGFADYFLIVWDFITQARKKGILVGPGRGSAAGSLVSYCLGISHIDPVANGLLFERFLNPERISMPDIDTDLPDNRRDEVIDYLISRYGQEHVAHIVTYSTMKAKAALRDAARAMAMNMREVDRLCGLIGFNENLEQVYQNKQEFRLLVQSDEKLSRLYKNALKIENLPRHLSTHAGGIVVSKEPIEQVAPLVQAGNEGIAEQFSMQYLEDLGLVKFDLLSLKNLSTLQAIYDEVKNRHGFITDLLKLPLNDKRTYDLLQAGRTLGVFQLESEGIRQLLINYKPQRFEDIAAVLALYRPGPMKNIQLYLDARHGRKKNRIHPLLDNLLAESHGIFLYQEQIMKAAQIIGDFSLAQADLLRKAMSKKNRSLMEQYRKDFIQGAHKKGISQKEAENIFEVMERFTEYGFNKSHSYAYALVVYQMAFLKANFPLEFFAQSLNASLSDPKKSLAFLNEYRSMGLQTLPLSITRSQLTYQIEPGGLRLPLGLIKKIPRNLWVKFLEKRGPYRDVFEVLSALKHAGMNENQIIRIIKSGALDEFKVSRETLLYDLKGILEYVDLNVEGPDQDFLDRELLSLPVLHKQPVNRKKRDAWEREILGFYIHGHPVMKYRRNTAPIGMLLGVNSRIELVGMVTHKKEITTKNGKKMSFVTLEDESGSMDMALMPFEHEKWYPRLQEGMVLHVQGKKDKPKSFLGNWIEVLSESA